MIGLDLSPIQPTWIPPNCRFGVDDIEEDWVFARRASFDLVHIRYLLGSIKDWDALFRKSFAYVFKFR